MLDNCARTPMCSWSTSTTCPNCIMTSAASTRRRRRQLATYGVATARAQDEAILRRLYACLPCALRGARHRNRAQIGAERLTGAHHLADQRTQRHSATDTATADVDVAAATARTLRPHCVHAAPRRVGIVSRHCQA